VWGGTPEAEVPLRGQHVNLGMKGKHMILGGCCTRCTRYMVYAVHGLGCTQCVLYLGYIVLGVWCTRCQLMLMTWRDRERWLHIAFCNDGRVEDKKERAWG